MPVTTRKKPAAAPTIPVVEVDRAELAAALAVALSVTERRNTIPIHSNVCLRVPNKGPAKVTGQHFMTIEATDLDIVAKVKVPVQIEGAGFATTMLTHQLAKTVQMAVGTSVRITFDPKSEGSRHGKAQLLCGTNNASFTTITAEDWPAFGEKEIASRFGIPADTLCRALRYVQHCISDEEARYYLQGAFMHYIAPNGVNRHNGAKGWLRFVTTDGHRLGQADIEAPCDLSNMPSVIIPAKMVAVILKTFGKSPQGEVINIEVGSKGINAECGHIRLESKIIQGTFPDYQRVISSGNDKRLVVAHSELSGLIKRMKAVKADRAVRFSIAKDKLILSVKNADLDTTSDSIACEWDSHPLDIGFNVNYIADILGALARKKDRLDSQKITMLLADPGSPTLIRDEEQKDVFYVVMPMLV